MLGLGHDERAIRHLREWQKQHPLATDSEIDAAGMILLRNLHAKLFTPIAEEEKGKAQNEHRHA